MGLEGRKEGRKRREADKREIMRGWCLPPSPLTCSNNQPSFCRRPSRFFFFVFVCIALLSSDLFSLIAPLGKTRTQRELVGCLSHYLFLICDQGQRPKQGPRACLLFTRTFELSTLRLLINNNTDMTGGCVLLPVV